MSKVIKYPLQRRNAFRKKPNPHISYGLVNDLSNITDRVYPLDHPEPRSMIFPTDSVICWSSQPEASILSFPSVESVVSSPSSLSSPGVLDNVSDLDSKDQDNLNVESVISRISSLSSLSIPDDASDSNNFFHVHFDIPHVPTVSMGPSGPGVLEDVSDLDSKDQDKLNVESVLSRISSLSSLSIPDDASDSNYSFHVDVSDMDSDEEGSITPSRLVSAQDLPDWLNWMSDNYRCPSCDRLYDDCEKVRKAEEERLRRQRERNDGYEQQSQIETSKDVVYGRKVQTSEFEGRDRVVVPAKRLKSPPKMWRKKKATKDEEVGGEKVADVNGRPGGKTQRLFQVLPVLQEPGSGFGDREPEKKKKEKEKEKKRRLVKGFFKGLADIGV
ncbi:hypothetical protein N0V85_006759 [Neurospora sp. IMI 360204]|nr:hypothetical protein N0V85_006759 [Neurospora sp. IMI 360204]